jgi:glycosyltransferase involved in cell wall biosynthesis
MLPGRSLILDAQGAQNRLHFDRGIPRYVTEQLRAVIAAAPDAVRSVALNPARPLSGNLQWLLGSGRAEWSVPGMRPAGVPALYHVMSPFELDRSLAELWPSWLRGGATRTVVTLYDLIPLVFHDHYLREEAHRAHYLARAELVRAADQVLAISRATAADAERLLGVKPERITVIDAGVASRFAGTYDADEPAWRVLRHPLPQLRPGFMLYVSGVEFRKNNERLIGAYGRWPAQLRREHQLVLSCRMEPEARKDYEDHARRLGISPDELIMPGYRTDSELAALYRLCRLFVFASFYEGSGLPILEAMAAGAPVAASNTSASREIVDGAEATFDPFDEGEMATVLESVIQDDALLERLRERSARRVGSYTWEHVGERTLEGYEKALSGSAGRRRRRARKRIAWVSPWPPQQSGVATYSSRLVPEIARHVDVDVLVEGPVNRYAEPLEPGVQLLSADELDWSAELRHYDVYVYSMGNSAFHRHVYETLLRRGGVVLSHDVRLVGFYGWYAGLEQPEDPTARLAQRLHDTYSERIDAGAFVHSAPSPEEQTALGLFLTGEVQAHADRLIVHSSFAADVLRLDRPAEARGHAPITVLPHALQLRPESERPEDPARPTIVSFGVLSEVKGLATLIDAFARLAPERPGARLVLAGPAEVHERERWLRHAADAGVADQVEIPGYLDYENYERLLAAATLAAQLRTVTNGEASGAVCDCLGAGVPTLVTDLGWATELPADVAVRVPSGTPPATLASIIERLLADPDRRLRLEAAARAYAAETSFANVARRYLDVLGLVPAEPAG